MKSFLSYSVVFCDQLGFILKLLLKFNEKNDDLFFSRIVFRACSNIYFTYMCKGKKLSFAD